LNPSTPAVAVVGAGYVGLITAAGLASKGLRVWCVDQDPVRVKQLKAGEVPFSEPGLPELLAAARITLHPVESLREAFVAAPDIRMVFVAVGTPTLKDKRTGEEVVSGAPDLDDVMGVAGEVAAYPGVAVVMKSTVPPGTGAEIVAAHPGLPYVSCPEFLQEGVAVRGFSFPDRVVIGGQTGCASAQLVEDLHRKLYPDTSVVRCDVKSAELVKYLSNMYLALRISFTSQVANLCEAVGADVLQVLTGVGADHRIGRDFLDAGIGFGGSCFEKDAKGLIHVGREVGVRMTLAEELLAINDDQIERAYAKLAPALPREQAVVAVLGLTFKPETSDLRKSRGLALVARLRLAGVAVRAWDPNALARQTVVDEGLLSSDELAIDALDAVTGADAVVLTTEWKEARNVDWDAAAVRMRGTLVLDGRNVLEPAAVAGVGLRYLGTGRDGVIAGALQVG
jgi:UDPglucose 6-dehydrogenase